MSKTQNLVLATGNVGKLREFEKLFSDLAPGQFTLSSLSAKVPELGQSYYENALTKAVAYYRLAKAPVLSDDSGIEVDALDGAPGVYSADFGGAELSWPERQKHLLAAIAATGLEERTARFRCVLCYWDGVTVPWFVEGTTEGTILMAPTGDKGFGYDPIFFSAELKKPFAEASEDEKNRVSHRAKAAQGFLARWNA